MSLKDTLIALTIITCWALHTVAIRIGVLEIPPLLLLSIRMAGTALLFLPFAKKISLAQLKTVGIYAFFYIFLHIGLLATGLHFIDSSTGALLLQTTTPFALLFGWLMHRETFGIKTASGLALAFTGVVIILYKPVEDFSYIGAGMILFSSLCWGFGTVFARKTSDVDLPTLTAYAHAIPLIPFLLLSLWLEPGQFHTLAHEADWRIVGTVSAFQIFIISLCHANWRNLMVRNPVYLVTGITMIQPLLTVVFAHFILGERLAPTTILGGAVSMLGVAIIIIRRIQRGQKIETP